jgi:type II secretory pathway pseudopilin PulG
MSSTSVYSKTSHASRAGMTLVEMLIATTITLIIMAAVAEVFGLFGAGVSDSRAVLELTDQMRSAAYRLRQDLAGATAPTLPPLAPEQELGYFEYIEGPASDLNPAFGSLVGATDTTSLTADCDDVLLFTTRSAGAPFAGRFGTGTLESPAAEVGWFCELSETQVPGGPTLFTLYRRQLLVTAYAGVTPFEGRSTNSLAWPGSWQDFYASYDLSCRLDATAGELRPNTLGDLTKRENRFLHNLTGTDPFPFITQVIPADVREVTTGETLGTNTTGTIDRTGEDVLLTNVLSFDVRAFDPNAVIQTRANQVDAVTAGDPGFAAGSAGVARGAYVDLNWLRDTAPSVFPLPAGTTFPPAGGSAFAGLGVRVLSTAGGANLLASAVDSTRTTATYDTWSTHYEADGIDQDGLNGPDQGTDGFDTDGDGAIDEADESETSAPYPVALRGIEIRIRCYEPSSRQIRQVTVRHTFVPH